MGRRRGRHVAARSKPLRWIFAVSVIAFALVAVGALLAFPPTIAAADVSPTASPTAQPFDKDWASGPAKVVAPVAVPEYSTIGSPLSMDDPYEGFVPVQCPEGTAAGSVDANGNQSNCEAVTTGG